MIKFPKAWSSVRRQKGNALVAYMLAAALSAGALVLARDYQISEKREREDMIAATYDKTVRLAVSRYVRENRQTILNAAAGGPVQITIPMLKNTQLLPAGWGDQNTFGNAYSAVSYRRVVGAKTFLHTLVVTNGGQVINESRLRNIVSKYPDGAGYISAQAPDVAKGANGMWSFPLADYGLPTGGGRLISALFFDEAGVNADYLYRNAVPGRPELNRMTTAIDMGGNNLNNASDVNANQNVNAQRNVNASLDVNANQDVNATRNMTASGSVTARNGNVAAGGALLIQRPDGAWSGGWTMADNSWIRSVGDKSIYTGGEVLAGRVTSAGRLRAAEYIQLEGIATEGWGCSPNGLIGRTGEGVVLSCQSGVWRSPTSSLLTVSGTTCPSGLTPIMYYGSIYNLYNGRGPTGWFSVGDMTDYTYACSEGGGDAGGTCDGRYNVNVPERASISMVKCG